MNARPTFSILHTSARPDAWRAVYHAWIGAAARPEDVEYVLVVDPRWGFQSRDESMHLRRSLLRPDDKCAVNTGRMCYVDGVNIAAENATGRILIVVADDQFPCQHWDDEIIRASAPKAHFQDHAPSCHCSMCRDSEGKQHPVLVSGVLSTVQQEFVIRVPTGTPQEVERNITVMPIISRARYERLGYIFYPGYESMFADNDLSEHAQHDGCFIEAADVPVFPHRHDWFKRGGSYREWLQVADSAYARQNRPEAYEVGARVLAERRATGFGSKLSVVPSVVPSSTVPNTGKNLALCIPGEWFHAQWVATNALQLCCHLFNRFRNVMPSMPVMSSVHSARHTCFAYIKALAEQVHIAFDYVLWIDDDNLLTPEQFEMLFHDLETHPEFTGVVGWCWVYPDTRISCGPFDETGCCRSFDYDKLMEADGDLVPLNFEMEDGKPVMKGPGGWSGFPVVLHRASLIDDIGKFPFRAILNDAWNTGMTGEDIAFFMKATESGLKFVVDRRVKVPHMKYGVPEPEFMKATDRKTMAYSEMKTAASVIKDNPFPPPSPNGFEEPPVEKKTSLLDKVRKIAGR